MLLPPQDYLIFHPARRGYMANGEAEIGGHVQAWEGVAWTDPWRRGATSNEDPFVWDPSAWLYSYCHASQLKRLPSPFQSTARVGSRLFFCETPAAKNSWLRVDTVFVVDEQAEWLVPATTVPLRFAPDQAAKSGHRWDRHLKHGVRAPGSKGHRGRYTYVANLDGRSYLPLDVAGEPTKVPVDCVAGLPPKVQAAVPLGRTTYPCAITTTEADELNKVLIQASVTRILKLTSGGPLGPQAKSLAPLPKR